MRWIKTPAFLIALAVLFGDFTSDDGEVRNMKLAWAFRLLELAVIVDFIVGSTKATVSIYVTLGVATAASIMHATTQNQAPILLCIGFTFIALTPYICVLWFILRGRSALVGK